MSNPATVTIRNVVAADVAIFFAQQLDPAANRMAAFERRSPGPRGL